MMMSRSIAAMFAVIAMGCGADNSLSGSVSELFPLDVSRAEVAVNQEALQVTYTFNRGVFLDIVARVSVSLEGLAVKPGLKIDLGGSTESGVLRCTVAHAPGGEPVRMLPPVKKGDFVVTTGGQPDAVTAGHFSMLFEREGGDLGAGRTLGGTFRAMTADAGFGD